MLLPGGSWGCYCNCVLLLMLTQQPMSTTPTLLSDATSSAGEVKQIARDRGCLCRQGVCSWISLPTRGLLLLPLPMLDRLQDRPAGPGAFLQVLCLGHALDAGQVFGTDPDLQEAGFWALGLDLEKPEIE